MPLSKEQLAELSGAAGQTRTKGPRMDLPTVTFDGKTGEMRMKALDGTLTPIAFPSELVILKKRNALKAYPMFSNEYDYASTIIGLFESENGRTKHIADGTPAQLREKFPTLKWMQPCYALAGGQLVKFEIKGASAGKFIEYNQTLKEAGLSVNQVFTIIPGASEGKNGAVTYKFMTFQHRDITPEEFDGVKEALTNVTAELYAIDKYYAEKKASSSDGVDAQPADDFAAYDTPAGDEVNPEDIPF